MAKQNCANCRYWSEMCAQSIGCGPMEALCLNALSPNMQKYMREGATCEAWASNHHGAVDAPPDYGRRARALYAEEEAA